MGAIIISVMWGLVPLIQKHIIQKISSMTLFVIDSFIYFLCIGIILFFNYDKIKTDVLNMTHIDVIIIVASTVLLGVSADVLYLYILQDHKNPFVLPIIYCGPIFTILLSIFFLRKDFNNAYATLGVFLIMCGIICISLYE